MQSASETSPAVYLSYNSREHEQVQPIAERLRSEGIRVWFDRWELHAGDRWEGKVEEAHRSPVWVVFLGAQGLGPYHQYEVEQATERAKALAAGKSDPGFRIIPVLLPDWPKSWNHTLPVLFREWMRIQFRAPDDEEALAQLISAIRRPEAPAAPSPAPPEPAPARSPIRLFRGHRGPVLTVAFAPDGASIASGGDEGTIRIWNLASGEGWQLAMGHRGRVQSVAFSADGRTLASGGRDNMVLVHDLGTGSVVRRLEGHRASVNALVFLLPGNLLVSGGEDGRLLIWETQTGRTPVHREPSHYSVNALALSRSGRFLAAVGQDERIRLLDPTDLTRRLEGKGTQGVLWSVAISPDDRWIAAGGDSGNVTVCQVSDGEPVRILEGNRKAVLGVAFLPDGRFLASAGADGYLRLWEVESGREVKHQSVTAGWVYGIAVSPDGRWIAAATDEGVALWDWQETAAADPAPLESDVSRPAEATPPPPLPPAPAFVSDPARFADVLARLVFRDRSLLRLCAQPDADAMRAALDAARGQPDGFEERLAEATSGLVPHPLWKAWLVNVHGDRLRQIGTELWAATATVSAAPGAGATSDSPPPAAKVVLPVLEANNPAPSGSVRERMEKAAREHRRKKK